IELNGRHECGGAKNSDACCGEQGGDLECGHTCIFLLLGRPRVCTGEKPREERRHDKDSYDPKPHQFAAATLNTKGNDVEEQLVEGDLAEEQTQPEAGDE